MHLTRLFFACILLSSWLLGCADPSVLRLANADATQAVITHKSQPLTTPTDCQDRFITHTLPFATGVRIREINTYESNGAGVAVNDLDGDGDLDLVFASIDNYAAILWNEGALDFRAEPLPARFTRGAQIVDVDGDDALDIVLTHRGLQPPSYWRNQGNGQFEMATLAGVESYAYSMGWADLTGDDALELVTGSYNIDLIPQGLKTPEAAPQAGVFLYTPHNGVYSGQRLSAASQALSIALLDLNGDAHKDIWVANDFELQDGVWLQQPSEWQAVAPFAQTSHSTMSIEWGDVQNNGNQELFTTDMMPYDDSPETMAAWQPVMDDMMAHHVMVEGDPQIMENMLQTPNADGQWQNDAMGRGVAATGWSWAGKLGDLDNDGLLDLYVVNGMIASNMFGHLPFGELIEENQAFRNLGAGSFTRMPQWGLGSTASGRGMVMADLDGDGDLDIVVNNLRKSAQLFENRLCGGGGLEVDLRWADSANSRAIGSQLLLHTDRGVLQRDVRASGGYLSGDPAQIHFGLPTDAQLERLEIRWPDGVTSELTELTQQTLVMIERQ
ncbi:MAG: FG-GAP-like repeat-containing protein [Caldilineaceae bacterium]